MLGTWAQVMCDRKKKKSSGIPFEGIGVEWPPLSRSFPGSVARITEQHLKVTDAESDDRQVIFIMKEDPGAGHLQMAKPDYPEQISVRGPIRSFTQADISQGQPVPRLSRFPLLCLI